MVAGLRVQAVGHLAIALIARIAVVLTRIRIGDDLKSQEPYGLNTSVPRG